SAALLFHHTPTTEIYTLSLHDALPIFIGFTAVDRLVSPRQLDNVGIGVGMAVVAALVNGALALHLFRAAKAGDSAALEANARHLDRKSTRLNSSHVKISYAVFCLKKKK